MPNGMWKQCRAAGCAGLTKDKYCAKHIYLEIKEKKAREHHYNNHVRDKKTQKLYDSTSWRKLRGLYIINNPLCESCFAQGKITKAVIVDHKTEIKDGGSMLDKKNLQSLCHSCHNKKTAIERSKRLR